MNSLRSFIFPLLFFSPLVVCSFAFPFEFSQQVPNEVRMQITSDLEFMSMIKGGDNATPLHAEIFGKVEGKNYKDFFGSRVTHVGMHTCGSANAVACVIPILGSSRIWLTKNYTQFSHPLIAKMMVVYHEARHTEVRKRNWPHANCPIPFKDKDGSDMKSIWTQAKLAGEPACDETPYGSYGSAVILLKNIEKFCENCTEKVKMDAALYGNDQFKRIIDANAIEAMKKDLYSTVQKAALF